jgi:hypothetical protein
VNCCQDAPYDFLLLHKIDEVATGRIGQLFEKEEDADRWMAWVDPEDQPQHLKVVPITGNDPDAA